MISSPLRKIYAPPVQKRTTGEYSSPMKHSILLFLALGLFAALTVCSSSAAQGAAHGLAVCAATLVPSLFPFFVLADLLSALGLPELLGRTAQPLMRRLFHVSGYGAQAFLLGLAGGYPLGASLVADLRRTGRISRSEGEHLLAFCNNSGPAFILGAMGGVFQSPKAGCLLYVTHVLAASLVGFLLRGKTPPQETSPEELPAPLPFGAAFGQSVSKALRSTLSVCAYVVFFGALLGMLTPLQTLPPLAAALVTGFLELGSGAAALTGLAPTVQTLAVAALLLGWGGLSVQGQTLSVIAGTDLRLAPHLLGRALCGVFAAGLTVVGAYVCGF
jgi:sporulation integral membrane protein YlbJ